jgi:hypothetical protein
MERGKKKDEEWKKEEKVGWPLRPEMYFEKNVIVAKDLKVVPHSLALSSLVGA